MACRQNGDLVGASGWMPTVLVCMFVNVQSFTSPLLSVNVWFELESAHINATWFHPGGRSSLNVYVPSGTLLKVKSVASVTDPEKLAGPLRLTVNACMLPD